MTVPQKSPTRTGKIARLPRSLRDEINRRLEAGEPAKTIIGWLNPRAEVLKRILAKHFNGRPISGQNLSEWRQGGYQDWLLHRETRQWAHLAAVAISRIIRPAPPQRGSGEIAEAAGLTREYEKGRSKAVPALRVHVRQAKPL